jgi:hypothetical protein
MLLPFPVLVTTIFIRRDRKPDDHTATLQIPYFGVLSQVAKKNHLVDHVFCPLPDI